MLQKKHLVILLGLLSAIGPFSIDMYLPGFKSIAFDLNTSVQKVSLSLSSYFIGVSVGQLLYGPLIDRFGRKKPLIAGLLLYLIASLSCAYASSIEMLISFRLLQALGGCAGIVTCRAIVRDLFSVQESAMVFSTLMLIVGISPIIAPVFGSFITAEFTWQYIFFLLAILALGLLIIVAFFMPETKKPDVSISLAPNGIVKNYVTILRVPYFYTYAFSGSLAAACFYIYLTGSPYLFLKYYKLTENEYSLIFAIIASAFITATQLNKKALKKYKSEQIMKTALGVEVLIGIILFTGSMLNAFELYSTTFLILLFFTCHGFILPNIAALCLFPFTFNAGSASALLGFLQMGAGAIASTILNNFQSPSAIPMTAGMCGLALLSFIMLHTGRLIILNKKTILKTSN